MVENSNKEKNQIKEKFNAIESNINDIENLTNILFAAIDNDFAPPGINEIQNYICIIQQYIEKHKTLLKSFIKCLSLPDNKADLILLRKTVFDHDDKTT